MHRYANELGEPDFLLGAMQIWLHNHDVEEDWLTLTAHCGAEGASVWASGALLQLRDFIRFGEQCAELDAGRADKAALQSPYEIDLSMELTRVGPLGHLEMVVHITPNQMTQEHRFRLGIDLSYLPELRHGIARISARFRGDKA